MPPIEGMTEYSILLSNDEGVDDIEEWHVPDFGRDADFYACFEIYRRHRDGMGYAYAGGWAEQLATHIEIIELFQALDALIKRPEDGDS